MLRRRTHGWMLVLGAWLTTGCLEEESDDDGSGGAGFSFGAGNDVESSPGSATESVTVVDEAPESAAAEACQAYFDALEACYTEAGLDESLPTYEDTCAAYEGLDDDSAVDILLCSADAIEAEDCSTDEGLEAISTAAEDCVG